VFRRIEVVGDRVRGVDRLRAGSAMDRKGTVCDGRCAVHGALCTARFTV
jgi:hypothetical protein